MATVALCGSSQPCLPVSAQPPLSAAGRAKAAEEVRRIGTWAAITLAVASRLSAVPPRQRGRRQPLHFAEALELTRDRPKRCPVCAIKVLKRPKILSLSELYKPWSSATGEKDPRRQSDFVARFLRDKPQQWAALLRPEYHIWHSRTKRFHKELSESLALLNAARNFMDGPWHALDLCCGKSLTSALLSLEEMPPEAITAVDLRPLEELPHHDQALQRAAELQMCQGRAHAKVPVEYWRCDVLAHDFVQSLARRVEGMGRPAAILAMHLCGRLSLQAISAFRQIDLIRSRVTLTTPNPLCSSSKLLAKCCVLGPCCLPHSSDAPKELQDVYGIGMSDEEQFDAWAAHLEKLLRRIPGVNVTRKIETGILSSRRLLFTAVKAESCSSA
ncbi:Eno2 [Symbiodinium sp. CCMP2456]|nr:Eno2 [Symbiodinium sp. CCMP2456]